VWCVFPCKYRSRHYDCHTVKWLVGITPGGTVVYISDAYPGSTGDADMVRLSGLLDLLDPGDALLCDRGFNILGPCVKKGIFLIMPTRAHRAGRNGRQFARFTEAEMRFTYEVATIRVHVERAMRVITGGWAWMYGPIRLVHLPIVDDLFRVSAYLTTLGMPLQGNTWWDPVDAQDPDTRSY